MPSVQAVTDSPPPVRSSPRKRQLKRESSAASIASLPTPPPTKHHGKRKRAQSRGSVYDTDTDTSDHEDAERSPASRGLTRKKRRTGLDAIATSLAKAGEAQAAEEDAFWMGTSRAGAAEPRESGKRVTLESPPPLLLRPNRVKAPVSPPPSRRRTRSTATATPAGTLTVVAAEVPVTPPRRSTRSKGKEKTKGPIRDSGSNPFLVDDDASPTSSPVGPRTPKPHVEKPTLTYVFRGVKTTFANPLYEVDPAEHARSLLPPEHPDFEPSEACPPKLLFPSARREQPARKAKTTVPASIVPRTPSPRRGRARDEDDEDARPPRTPRGRTLKKTPKLKSPRAGEKYAASAVLKAIGPVRPTKH